MSASWQATLRDCLRLVAAPRRECVARREAFGRLLLGGIAADRDYPSDNLSQMDGYAIGDDARAIYQVEGENRPGAGPGGALATGYARRIFTGAALPSGAVRVIPQELTARNGNELQVLEMPDTFFVRRRGSEAKTGEEILSPGTRLGAIELSILASVGAGQVDVSIRPRVAHLVTGDEIADPDLPAAPGLSLRDSNSVLVATVLRGIGQHVLDHRRVKDDREKTIEVVREMAASSELLLISGGASVGDHDHARAALEAAGFHFEAHGINVRPGKPVGLARRGDQWAVALPGNPVSHLVAMHLFVVPLLLALEGQTHTEPQLIQGILAEPAETDVPRRDTFWPAAAELREGVYHLRARRFFSSGDLFGVARANALLFFPTGQAIPQKGVPVYFLLLLSSFS